MTEQKSAGADRRRERRIAGGILCALVVWRTSVLLIWPQAYFDSDQAVFGLMAKHLSELRAFPMFMYGQNYILAVEAWLAAPFFLLFGASAVLLKLPLLIVNLAVVLVLLRTLEREANLRPAVAAVPALFFALPPPGTSALLLDPSGGNLEPFLYVLLLWLTRFRPNWCGLIFGIGFLHREFTIYGIVALLIIDLRDRTLFTREHAIRWLKMFRTAAEVWLVVQFAKQFASAAGPGTSIALVQTAPSNLHELLNRICIAPRTLLFGLGRLVTVHWPDLFGAIPSPLGNFSIESAAWQGLYGAWVLYAATFALAAAGLAWALLSRPHWRREYSFCAYLILVGLLSAVGYVAGRCGEVERMTMRYELLSILGAIGAGALFLCTAQGAALRRTWIALALACIVVNATGHMRFTVEYVMHRPIGQKELLVRHLEARGVQYGSADYWVAYYVSFMTGERIVLASTDFVRVKSYEAIVAAHRDTAVRISREFCEGGRHLTESFFICPIEGR